MRRIIRTLTTRFLVALLTFAAGVAVTLLWVVPRLRTVSPPRTPALAAAPQSDGASVPDGWRRLEVKNKVVMWLPPEMKPTEPIGDMPGHREAYNNRGINLTIAYANPVPCDTSRVLLERSTYSESLIEVSGRQAKLGVDYYYQPETIIAHICFLNADDSGRQLRAVAYCKDDRALEDVRRIFTNIRFKDSR